MKKIIAFFRREAVFCIALICALISVIFVPPCEEYKGYIDLRVLCLLFCLMCVSAGFGECGVFESLAGSMRRKCRSSHALEISLVFMPFFASMLVTNDVALITFVPFAIMTMKLSGLGGNTARVVVLQTVAANIGSMATPVGNPQNLFLYAKYELSPAEFFKTVLPPACAGMLLLAAVLILSPKKEIATSAAEHGSTKINRPWALCVYLALFLLSLLSVFRLLDYRILTLAVVAALLFVSPRILAKADYMLLLTFVCFFVFAGNMGQIEAVQSFLGSCTSESAMLTSAFASQGISNVPAAVLLSGFTEDWRGLILGTDIGGLGTPVASLASLISLKLYLRSENANGKRYMLLFMLVNLVGLAVLLTLAAVVFRV